MNLHPFAKRMDAGMNSRQTAKLNTRAENMAKARMKTDGNMQTMVRIKT